jgi:hypothetical protein
LLVAREIGALISASVNRRAAGSHARLRQYRVPCPVEGQSPFRINETTSGLRQRSGSLRRW